MSYGGGLIMTNAAHERVGLALFNIRKLLIQCVYFMELVLQYPYGAAA